ncbi:ATP-binding cassette domain-containing protein [Longibacter sp.]|uniref:ATP-binding cassette domain-containing protein n=1 Tax=Longibacter sp. TaxID=2045415 RepID=UPI003EBFFFB6
MIPDLTIESGTATGVVGNNGAGKTTVLRLVLDLIDADPCCVSHNEPRRHRERRLPEIAARPDGNPIQNLRHTTHPTVARCIDRRVHVKRSPR